MAEILRLIFHFITRPWRITFSYYFIHITMGLSMSTTANANPVRKKTIIPLKHNPET